MTAAVMDALDWQRRGACRGINRDIFFPDDIPDPRALALCHRCPVKEACLDWALSHDEVGIWGGLTDEQRTAINRRRHRVRCPDCRSDNVAELDRSEICLSCGLSWPV